MKHRSFAVKLLVHSLSKGARWFLLAYQCAVVQCIIDQPYEDIVDEQALDALDEMARDEQQPWLTDGAFAMFTTLLSQGEYWFESIE
jgi:hypothetical protein